ncbi:MAG: hypothetical protein WBA33_10925 [Rhodanobacter lindaniclasticus]
MSVADILRECGIVPTVPTVSPRVGTLQTLVASHVPTVPSVPTEKHKARAQPLKSAPVSRGDCDRMRAALLVLADGLGLDRAIVHRLTTTDLADCAGFPSDALRVYLLALDDTVTRQAGKVPLDDTAAIRCERCGPVYVHRDIAAVLPVVNGWPRALGCPWCFVRKAGGYIPRPPVTCEGCRHFSADTINPTAGIGTCGSGHGMHYPMQHHGCGDYRPKGTDHD